MRPLNTSSGLLQAGEVEAVLELGERVLDTWESRALRRDILLSMALAHCNLATRALERDTSVGREPGLPYTLLRVNLAQLRMVDPFTWKQTVAPAVHDWLLPCHGVLASSDRVGCRVHRRLPLHGSKRRRSC